MQHLILLFYYYTTNLCLPHVMLTTNSFSPDSYQIPDIAKFSGKGQVTLTKLKLKAGKATWTT